MRTPERSRRRSRVVRVTWISLLVLGIVVLVGVGWVGVRALLAKQELEAAVPIAESVLGGGANAGSGSAEALADLAGRTAEAAELTGDPVWRVFETAPWIGDDLRAMRVLATSADRLVRDAALPLASTIDEFGDGRFRFVDGRLDPALAADAAPALPAAARAVASVAHELRAIEGDGLLPPLADARDRLRTAVDGLAPSLAVAARFAPIAPALLGADGPRDYLVLLLNPAELRATGGIPGQVTELHVDDGAISIDPVRSNATFVATADPVEPLTDATTALYGTLPGRFVQDVTMTPDFALTASLAREFWRTSTGREVDGVIAVDPGLLPGLLQATGPIEAGGVALTSDDAVQALLVDSYLRFGEDQGGLDAFFAQVGDAMFAAVLSGRGDTVALAQAGATAVAQGRISIWSADSSEERVLADSVLGGPLAALDADGAGAYGVYFNDGTGGKMGPYLDAAIDAGTVVCRADGRSEVRLRVALTNTAPADAAARFPWLVLTGSQAKLVLQVAAYGEPGGYHGLVQRDGRNVAAVQDEDRGRPVSLTRATVAPGETVVLEFGFLSPDPVAPTPHVRHTPIVGDARVGTWQPGCGTGVPSAPAP